LPTKCENTAECLTGCCYDGEEGLCSTKSTKYSCESKGGTWEDEENCLVSECEKGCCVLGANVEYTTERRCELLSVFNGYEKNFKDSLNELECIAIESFQETGACILTGNSCIRTTRTDCIEKAGTFYRNYLCSNSELNTSCKKQSSVGCNEGNEEIYWFDSCGNKENIYSSDKDASWNNG
jgi:hypothetical protein